MRSGCLVTRWSRSASPRPGAPPTWRYLAAGSRGRLIGWREREDDARAVMDVADNDQRLVVFVRETTVTPAEPARRSVTGRRRVRPVVDRAIVAAAHKVRLAELLGIGAATVLHELLDEVARGWRQAAIAELACKNAMCSLRCCATWFSSRRIFSTWLGLCSGTIDKNHATTANTNAAITAPTA